MQWKEDECKLKPARGKRVALKISNKAPYAEVWLIGIEKWKAYHSNKFIEDEEYCLTYQDGQEVLFLPGTTKFFSAKRYREESGKDYKRITLYLCRKDYLRRNEDIRSSKPQVDQDELIARELQHRFNNESCDNDKVNIGEDQEDVLIISGDEISMQLPDESD